jgi:excisionase family DNA binding protein
VASERRIPFGQRDGCRTESSARAFRRISVAIPTNARPLRPVSWPYLLRHSGRLESECAVSAYVVASASVTAKVLTGPPLLPRVPRGQKPFEPVLQQQVSRRHRRESRRGTRRASPLSEVSHVPQFTGISEQGPLLGRSVSIDQAARLLNVSRRTIYNRIREGRLRTVRTLGGSQRVLVDSLGERGTNASAFSPTSASVSRRPVQG